MKADVSIHQEIDEHTQWYSNNVEPKKQNIVFEEWCNVKIENIVLKKNLQNQLRRAIEYNALFDCKIPSVHEILASWRIKL